MRGRADEARDEPVGRPVVELERHADLLDAAQTQDHDLVGHGHRLDLVVRDVDHGVAESGVQVGELDPHLHAKLGIEIGERLVEQEDPRLAHHCPTDGDALTLPARELARPPREELLDLQHPCRRAHPLLDLGAGHLHVLEAEGEVLPDRHVRIEGIGLEDHGEAALRGAELVDALTVDADLARRYVLEPGDHAQKGRLAATGRADEDAERTVLGLQVDAMDHLDRAEALGHAIELEGRHDLFPWPQRERISAAWRGSARCRRTGARPARISLTSSIIMSQIRR